MPTYVCSPFIYQCEYGPHDNSDNTVAIHEGLVTEKQKLDKKMKQIPNGKMR